MPQETNIIIFGAPGAGKGTQAKKIRTELGIPHIDTGHLIRKAIEGKSELGTKAQGFVEAGKLVPDDLVIDLIKERLGMFKNSQLDGFILDGYPRTIAQADALQKMLKELKLDITKVINMKIPEEILVKRLSSRRVCSKKLCGEIYNLLTKKPKEEGKCDLCGSDLYQRKDDTQEAAKERLNEYHNKTAPLEKYYRDLGKLYDVDSSKNEDEVYNEILRIVTSDS